MNSSGMVLIVDDQPLNVKILSTYLSAADYEVVKAYDSREALDLALRVLPDIILLDIMMPEMDGYTVASILKGDHRTKGIPIVLVTALEGADDKVKGVEAGADDFLSKPVNKTELLARVRSLVKLKRLQEALEKKVHTLDYVPAMVAAEATPREKVILLVEDDEKQVKSYRLLLESAGYTTMTAPDSASVLAFLDETVPNLILLDILLGDANGLELLTRLKADPIMADIPIIIISALGDLETRVKGIECGAEDYFVKPINSIEMLARSKANLRKNEASTKLKTVINEYFTQAITDPLTGLYNRQYLKLALERLLASATRYNSVTSFLMLDIDHFKEINDTFGHLVGDTVLKELGSIFSREARGSDIVARFGGEEFIVILPETDAPGARVFAERIRSRVEGHLFPQIEHRTITISIGVTMIHQADPEMNTVIKRADDALYRAKQGGRNRVEECV